MLVYLINQKEPVDIPAQFYYVDGGMVVFYNKAGEEEDAVETIQLGLIKDIQLENMQCMNLCVE